MNTASTTPRPTLPADYHLHTPLCQHASGTPAEFRQSALTHGVPELCFTDHCPEPSGYDSRHRMTIAQYTDYLDMLRPLQDGEPPAVYRGIEADYFPGCEAFLREWLPRQAFTLVLGSIHYIRDWNFDNPNERQIWQSVDVAGVWRIYFQLLTALVDTRLFDVIGHFDLPKKFGHRLPDRTMKDWVQPVLDRIAKAGMAIEINTSGWRREVAEAYPSPLILSLAREREIPITFGSDAHQPSEVGYAFKQALALAREAGYQHSARYRNRQITPVPLPA